MKIFAPAVIGAGLGVFALAVMVGGVAVFGPTATPGNGITVAVDTVGTSLYLMILGWPIAGLLGGLGGTVVGLIQSEAVAQGMTETAILADPVRMPKNRHAIATPIARKPRPARMNSFNQPA